MGCFSFRPPRRRGKQKEGERTGRREGELTRLGERLGTEGGSCEQQAQKRCGDLHVCGELGRESWSFLAGLSLSATLVVLPAF